MDPYGISFTHGNANFSLGTPNLETEFVLGECDADRDSVLQTSLVKHRWCVRPTSWSNGGMFATMAIIKVLS